MFIKISYPSEFRFLSRSRLRFDGPFAQFWTEKSNQTFEIYSKEHFVVSPFVFPLNQNGPFYVHCMYSTYNGQFLNKSISL